MAHGRDLLERLPDEGAHSKCEQTAFSEAAQRRVEVLRFAAEMRHKSQIGRSFSVERAEYVCDDP